MRHKHHILYTILPFLFISLSLSAQTPFNIHDAIINPRYADSVPLKQRLPRTDRTIQSNLPNCYATEGDSIITGMKYTYNLYFVNEVHEKYCSGMMRKTRSKGYLPDSIYTMARKQFENHKAKGLPNNAAIAKTYFEEAKNQFSQNHYGASIASFLVAATIDKSTREAALINMGLGLYNLKRYEDATYYYQAAIKENPKSYEAYLNMGAAAKQIKDDSGFSMESVYFKIAYDLKPHAHKAIYNYATTLLNQFDRKNNDLATTYLTEATSLDPENATYIWALGKAYYNTGFMENRKDGIQWYRKAIDQYNKAISKDKNLQNAYLSKARALYLLYEGSDLSSDRKIYMDAINECYAAFKAIGGIDTTGLFKRASP